MSPPHRPTRWTASAARGPTAATPHDICGSWPGARSPTPAAPMRPHAFAGAPACRTGAGCAWPQRRNACAPAFTSAPIPAGILPAWQGCSRQGVRLAASSPNDPAAWGHAARSLTAGEKSGGPTPALVPATQAASARFIARFRAAGSPIAVEPFGFRPDLLLPGTLHHSGNRPAPPSDHIPLARRSAFLTLLRASSDVPARPKPA